MLDAEDVLGHDFTGQSVAVLLPVRDVVPVLPYVVRTARSVKVFQDHPAWVLPFPAPIARRPLARLNLRIAVRDAWTRRLLTPHRFGRRDVVVGAAFYRALQQPHCKLVAWPVYAVLDDGVRTAEGIEHRADVLIIDRRIRQELAA